MLPVERPDALHIFNQFVIRTGDRDGLRAHLTARGIGTEIYYPVPFHLQACFADLGHKAGDFPVAEAAAADSLALPIYGELTEAQQRYVVDSAVEYARLSAHETSDRSRRARDSVYFWAASGTATAARRAVLPGCPASPRRSSSASCSASPSATSGRSRHGIKPLADAFLRMIKMIIAPLLFSTLVVGIAGTGDLKAMGRIGLKAIIYFEVATTIALFIGLAMVNIFQPGAGLAAPVGADTVATGGAAANQQKGWDIFLHLFPTSVIDSMAKGDILQMVVFATFFGIALAAIGSRASR